MESTTNSIRRLVLAVMHLVQELRIEARVLGRWIAAFQALFLTLGVASGFAADLVVIRSESGDTAQVQRLEAAARFYGVDVTTLQASTERGLDSIAVLNNDVIGIAIEASALSDRNREEILRTTRRGNGDRIPILVFGVTPDTDPAQIRAWSGGSADGSGELRNAGNLEYVAGRVPDVTRQLSGIVLPFASHRAFYLKANGTGSAPVLLSIRSGAVSWPSFVAARLGETRVFLLAGMPDDESSLASAGGSDLPEAFGSLAPEMIFLRYAAGERGWHPPTQYANLTIDDPWLREPYGFLDYRGLLGAMEAHNFHTTIAFVPWNYDRSDPAVVSIFREHPERYSIAVHGDNHDHKEFEDFRSKSLGIQVSALRQSILRMDEFQRRTGIPYDRAFIFPHSIGEEGILEELKIYNYEATFNSTNLPMKAIRPHDDLFPLRPVTISFGDFACFQRNPAELPDIDRIVAINAFLGNAQLFYTHQQFFAKGIDAFDHLADTVNQVEPATKWSGLGEISAHAYLLRQLNDSEYDVLAFTSDIRLENRFSRSVVYHVVKKEHDASLIAKATVDGQTLSYGVQDGYLRYTITVPAGQSRSIVVDYKNDLDSTAVDIGKTSLRVYLLRRASDFRDIRLAHFRIGAAATAFYYDHNGSPMRVAVLASLFITLALIFARWLWLVRGRKLAARSNIRAGELEGV